MLKLVIDVEMPKESDSLNTDDSSSKMTIPNRSEVEEVIISDGEEQVESGIETYEDKLNKKLKDLDLFEEGMTIQQKEELLAVVVASWETAKEETTRRQFYQGYMQASEGFCNNDQIEFTFQKSPELSNDASLLAATIQKLDARVSQEITNDSHRSVCSISLLNKKGDYSASPEAALSSSPQSCENEKNCLETYPEFQPSTSRDWRYRGRSFRRGRPRKGKSDHRKLSFPSSSIIASETELDPEKIKETKEILDKEIGSSRLFEDPLQQNSQSLEESISSWKPCLSPKETPLFYSKKPWLNEQKEVCKNSVEECAELINSFTIARRETQKSHPPDRTLVKPYHLTRRGNFSKKSTRPDRYDIMVGVPTKMTTIPALPETDTKDLLCRTGSSFQSVKTTGRSVSENEALVTRSGVKYGFYNQTQTDAVQDLKPVEQWPPKSPSPLFSDVEVILEEQLPSFNFNNVRPVVCSEGIADSVNNEIKCEGICSSKTNCNSCDVHVDGVNHTGSSANMDNDSSEASSVIDVETIVDEEIEEFVSKRKLLQELQNSSKESSSTQRKRLKKGAT